MSHKRAGRWVSLPSLVVLGTIALASTLGPFFLSHTFWEADLDLALQPPSWLDGHYLGTDLLGRDQLARILQGGQISLMVALVGTCVAGLIGIPYGAIAGWAGGRLDEILMRFVDLLYSIPFMFMAILAMVLLAGPRSSDWGRMALLFVVLGSVSWLTLARIVRGQVLRLRVQPFTEAAIAMGATHSHILLRHLLPNVMGVVLVYLTLTVPSVILQEAFLSFLGLGVRSPMASWGTLLNDGVQAMAVAPWLMIGPAAFLIGTLLSLNILGDHLRDAWGNPTW